jgi:hypothetical protein
LFLKNVSSVRLLAAGFGEMAEWFKAAVLKTVVGQPTGGSNPSLSAMLRFVCRDRSFLDEQFLERWPSG